MIVEKMKASVEPQAFGACASQFPGQIDNQPQGEHMAELLPEDNKLNVDGHEVEAIHVGQAAVPDSTIVWVASLRLAVCGAVVYGEGHRMLAFCPTMDLRRAWISSAVCGEREDFDQIWCWSQSRDRGEYRCVTAGRRKQGRRNQRCRGTDGGADGRCKPSSDSRCSYEWRH